MGRVECRACGTPDPSSHSPYTPFKGPVGTGENLSAGLVVFDIETLKEEIIWGKGQFWDFHFPILIET